MTLTEDYAPPTQKQLPSQQYSLIGTARSIFKSIVSDAALDLPREVLDKAGAVKFTLPDLRADSLPILPCIFKECETVAALKGLEGAVASALAAVRFGPDDKLVKADAIEIDLQHATMFLFMAYLASVDGLTKLEPAVKTKLVDTDLLHAQSDPYRRMSANLYRTKDGKFFHIHGSLEATTTLEMIGLPGFIPGFTDYEAIIEKIEGAVSKFTAAELEVMNAERRQAGVTALPRDEFLATPHGQVVSKLPIYEIERLETETPPAAFAESSGPHRQVLAGVKVLELCRIIAGPTIARILAEYGADVLKVTGPGLSDVPFFQVDGNMGKHTTEIDLKSAEGRATFEQLVADADVIVDGYRTGAFERLGYPPSYFADIARKRGKGFVYVSENCFGFKGEWAHRPGWQQIADCVSGVAWGHGKSMGSDAPVIPPFPMSDYGTGCIGAIGALHCLYKRATEGGSYWATTSLVQYDLLLMNQGQYPDWLWTRVRDMHDPEVRALRYCDSVDRISSTALKSCIKLRPDVFAEAFGAEDDQLSDEEYNARSRYMERHEAPGFHGTIKVLKPVVRMRSAWNGFLYTSRPNAFDPPKWQA